MQGASVVRVLDQLEAAGLLARTADSADRRTNRIRLTASGRALLGRIEESLAALRHELTEGISDSALAIADAVLERIDQRMIVLRERDR